MSKDTVGDRLAPALRQEGSALAAAASAKRIDAQAAPNAVDDIKKKSVAQAIKNQEAVAVPQGSCKQVLWFSFFLTALAITSTPTSIPRSTAMSPNCFGPIREPKISEDGSVPLRPLRGFTGFTCRAWVPISRRLAIPEA